MSAARPPPAREAATPGLPSMSDSGFNKLFTDTPGSVQSGRLYDAQHTQVGHYNDEGRALFRATWSPLSAFAHPRNPKKGLKVPGDLKLAGVEEREKQFEGRAGNVLRMMDRISAHLAAVEKAEADDDEERSEYSDEP